MQKQFLSRLNDSMKVCKSLHFLNILPMLLFLFFQSGAGDLHADGESLLKFIDGLDGAARKLNWTHSTSPCTWQGVECTPRQDNVVAVKLPGIGLYGTIGEGTLGSLSKLQIISLRSNHLSGALPRDFVNCTQLRKLFLQGNFLTGPILAFSNETNPQLTVIDLSFNKLTGILPSSLSTLPHLKTLLLQNNALSGNIPPSLSSLSQLNVSNNNLSGSIPVASRNFPRSSFSGNAGLCGPPLVLACENSTSTPSSSSINPSKSAPLTKPVSISNQKPAKRQLSTSVIALIVIADVAFLFLLGVFSLHWYQKRHCRQREENYEKELKVSKDSDFAKAVGDVDDGKEGYNSAQEPEHNKLVFFHVGHLTFDLEDLLRASAEVLGKGTYGTSYKAVLEDGPTVVVKRLKEASIGKKEFEQHLDLAGKMQHDNLVLMRAYYYSKEEKLLVHEYLPLGNLSFAIHGEKGSESILYWDSRLKIAAAAARGLEYLHGTSSKYVHGDIKPSNILLHPDFGACLSDYGLAPLFWAAANNAAAVANRMSTGYRAPEVAKTRKLTQKSDVYSFGVVLLELLTGKEPSQTSAEQGMDLPKWVQSVVREEWTSEVFDHSLMKFENIEEEMVQLLQVSLACVSPSPDQRPTMAEVLKMIQDIRRDGYQTDEARSPTITHSSSLQGQCSRGSPAMRATESPDLNDTEASCAISQNTINREGALLLNDLTNTVSEVNMGSAGCAGISLSNPTSTDNSITDISNLVPHSTNIPILSGDPGPHQQ
ncbi:hypothetical protein KP509_23G000600 [Ceratopteris richardii]|uniref:Protein kinase domain-containing protein n=1 Tax=Ceratopteris richardii TaxID=49495 RepID=A0A8T2RZM1_CERRI|nr:hypothetical protein KP509_23G000600 [Ceratopteris richardii]KAH7300865.1 hypothetical protein KP509_23G000600 [Ceratopteris richardii]